LAGNDDDAKAAALKQVKQYDDAINGLTGLADKTQNESSRALSKINYIAPQVTAPTPFSGAPKQTIDLGGGLTAVPTDKPDVPPPGGKPPFKTGDIGGKSVVSPPKKGGASNAVNAYAPLNIDGALSALGVKMGDKPSAATPAHPKVLQLPKGKTEATMISDALAAIKQGAPRDKVVARLKQYSIKLPNGG